MGISPRTVEHLRARKHDVLHVADLGMAKATDAAIIERAREERRTIITADLDFSALMARSGDRRPSVVTLRLADFRPPSVNLRLDATITAHFEALDQGALVTVTERAARVRRLPI